MLFERIQVAKEFEEVRPPATPSPPSRCRAVTVINGSPHACLAAACVACPHVWQAAHPTSTVQQGGGGEAAVYTVTVHRWPPLSVSARHHYLQLHVQLQDPDQSAVRGSSRRGRPIAQSHCLLSHALSSHSGPWWGVSTTAAYADAQRLH